MGLSPDATLGCINEAGQTGWWGDRCVTMTPPEASVFHAGYKERNKSECTVHINEASPSILLAWSSGVLRHGGTCLIGGVATSCPQGKLHRHTRNKVTGNDVDAMDSTETTTMLKNAGSRTLSIRSLSLSL